MAENAPVTPAPAAAPAAAPAQAARPANFDRHKHFSRGGPRPHAGPGGPSPLGDEIRVRMPRRYEGEIFAQVVEQKGGSRMIVDCEDGKQRLCRIPGRIRQRLWVKDGDYLIIKPWSVEGDAKCDLEYRYTGVQVDALRRRGLLKMAP